MAPRISPLKDATHYVLSKSDKTCKLEVKYINEVKGRGVFAKTSICKGDFVVEYRGDIINDTESQGRRKLYHPSCAAFMFVFKWKEKTWCIDASREDRSFGRLVNDEHRYPNCRMKKIEVNGKPHLCLFALNNIKEGEEITYDYGGEDCPWRTQTTSITTDSIAADRSKPLPLSANQIDVTGQHKTHQQTTSITTDSTAADRSKPSPLSANEIDVAGQHKTHQKTTSITTDSIAADRSKPSPLSANQIDVTGQHKTHQQTTSITTDSTAADRSKPSPLSANQVDVTDQHKTHQKMKDTHLEDLLIDESISESADDYIPDTTSDSDTDSDASLHSNRSIQRSLDYTRDISRSLSSPVCDIKMPDNITFDSNILTSEATGGEEEPCSSQNLKFKSNPLPLSGNQIEDDTHEQMKNTDVEDLMIDESISESADDYIPDTTSDSDTDSDASLHPNRRIKKSLDYTRDISRSLSPPVCDTTTPDAMTFDSNILTSEATGAEEEPCSSQNINDRVVVSSCHNKGGKRVYDKRHYCLYCSKPYAKMARHLESAHENKPDVAKALSFPKASKERKKQLDYIRNKGNFAHNAAVMESGKGELVPFKRPPKEAQGKDFIHCAYCQGLFTRKILWQHMRSCRLRPGSVAPKPGKNRVQSMCTYAGPVPSHISKQLWKVISVMSSDPITDIIKNDHVIIEIGQHLLNKGGISAKNQQYVREKMREMGRLVNGARRVTTLKRMEDVINPKKYIETVKAVKFTCGYDSEANKFLIPSLANKLGNT
ncbi:uncharacterized protein LOC120571949 isoform X2 [Perca fluviatilis]|uniref:uncharacterized protein LOC120571949 isoform X2 n=1 Tax=Perca fluviatilis TaxID=8168 RepID=UPI001965A40F|nr:uncharacterized protein LOC120571949 isoform X2 [Perca fluviatilis]